MLYKQTISPKAFEKFEQKNFNFAPPPPPDGRPDHWDLQFCRFWGWNWVLRSECDENRSKPADTKNMPKRAHNTKETSAKSKQKVKNKGSNVEAPVSCPPPKQLPTKQQLRELCKCIFKPPRKYVPTCVVPDLFQTPSHSTMLFQSNCSYAIEPLLPEANKEKPSFYNVQSGKSGKGSQIQPNVQEPHNKIIPCPNLVDTKYSESGDSRYEDAQYSKSAYCRNEIYSRQLTSDENASSTEESIEYISVRIKSDICCSCHGHQTNKSPINRNHQQEVMQKKESRQKYNLAVQTSQFPLEPVIPLPGDDKHTQTSKPVCKTTEVSTKRTGERYIKLGKKKVICLCVCCCPCSRQGTGNNAYPAVEKCQPIMEETDGDVPEKYSKQQKEKFDPNQQLIPEKQTSFTVKKSTKDKSKLDLPEEPDFSPYIQDIPKTNASLEDADPDKQNSMAFNVVIQPPSTKTFSKFGTPSKSYSWMKEVTSDNTTSSLSQCQIYRSPLTGKTYDLSSVNLDDQFKLTLPEAIDVSDDLVYLKQLDKSWKSDKESRLVLDAVCDAIMSEHEDNFKNYRGKDWLLEDNRDIVNVGAWKNTEDKVRKLNDVSDEIFENVTMSEEEQRNDTYSGVTNLNCQWKTDNSRKNISFSTRNTITGKKRTLYEENNEKSGKKLRHNDQKQIKKVQVSKPVSDNESSESTLKCSNKIDEIFAKIENIVKESKEKSREMRRTLEPLPGRKFPKPTSMKSPETRTKMYPMSSDMFKTELGSRTNQKESKKSYEIFSNDMRVFDKVFPKQEDVATLPDVQEQPESLENDMSEESLRDRRLSYQSFLVCDMKSFENGNVERELVGDRRIWKKKKSKNSLIPIRKRRY